MESFTGWTPEAVALVERSIAAHGGWELWRSTNSIRLPFLTGSGSLLVLKGFRRTFPPPREIEVFPHRCVTIFHGYPKEGQRGKFANGNVSIESADGSDVFIESRNHRRTFHGFAKLRSWSPLDAAYFFGYALWHYHVLPFTFGTARLHRVLRRRGAPAGVDVIFPADIPTHCRRQQFFFDAAGRIVRHDYVAEAIGPLAWGSHFWEDYDRSAGLVIARRRRVVARLGPYATPLEVWRVQMGAPIIDRMEATPPQ